MNVWQGVNLTASSGSGDRSHSEATNPRGKVARIGKKDHELGRSHALIGGEAHVAGFGLLRSDKCVAKFAHQKR